MNILFSVSQQAVNKSQTSEEDNTQYDDSTVFSFCEKVQADFQKGHLESPYFCKHEIFLVGRLDTGVQVELMRLNQLRH